MNKEEIAREVEKLGPWSQNIDLDGVMTAPRRALGEFVPAIPANLAGKTVLDIGCNAGLYSIEMKRRGAARVVGIDSDESSLAQAKFAASVTGAEIELRKMDVYEVGALREKFDLVLFMGVLAHLRHPLLALDIVHDRVVGGTMILQTMLRGSSDVFSIAADHPLAETDVFDARSYPKLHFVEKKYAGDATWWWIPNRACVEAMLRSAGFRIDARPEAEVYVCSCAPTD